MCYVLVLAVFVQVKGLGHGGAGYQVDVVKFRRSRVNVCCQIIR